MTGWSWKLGRVAGIDVYVHGTFLILLTWIAVSHYVAHHRVVDAVAGVVFTLALFGIVVLHELGHALTARRYGIRTRDITLLPIGGVARLERMPEDPKQELVVALAGPAVNVALAGLLVLVVTPTRFADVQWIGGDLLSKLVWVNVTLAVFNLIPAFPMDGGRALRAVLAMRMEYVRATQVAAEIGRGLALVFGLIGLFTNPMLVFIALFVWIGATAEASTAQMKSALSGIPVSRAMVTHFETLSPTDTLERAMDHVLAGFQHDFPVTDAGRVIGLLTRTDLIKGLKEKGRDAPVSAAMTGRFETAAPTEMLEVAVQRLSAASSATLPVLDHSRLVGVLTPDNVGDFLALQSALRTNGTHTHKGESYAGSRS